MSENTLGSTTVVHVAIVVRDIKEKVEAWSALLGQPVPRIFVTGPVEEAQTRYQGEPTPAQAKLAFFRVGQIQLELIEPVGEPSTWHDQLVVHGESLHHIAFEIDGMEEQLELLAGHGVPLIQRGEYRGGRYAYVDGGERLGAILELLEND
jgi:methylmalonyl-CoA/ethylmalonyl-CoA epimerase